MAFVNKRNYHNSGCLLFMFIIVGSILCVFCARDILKDVFLKTVVKEKLCTQEKEEIPQEQLININSNLNAKNDKHDPEKIEERNVLDTLKVILKKVKDGVKSDSKNTLEADVSKKITITSRSSSPSPNISVNKLSKPAEDQDQGGRDKLRPFHEVHSVENEAGSKESETVLSEKKDVLFDKDVVSNSKEEEETKVVSPSSITAENKERGMENTPQRGTSFDASLDSDLDGSVVGYENFTNETVAEDLSGEEEVKRDRETSPKEGKTEVEDESGPPRDSTFNQTSVTEGEVLEKKAEAEHSASSDNETLAEVPESAKEDDSKRPDTVEDVNASSVVLPPESVSDSLKEKDQLETYSQFAERVLAEKKNGANGHGGGAQGGNGQIISKGPKVKSKNYASTDCGAKFLGANPQSSHSHKIINSNKDEYMLNTCTEKIWVTIELCESIRPQKFDIANFELFSSLPKDIRLYGSHRYPTREWVSLGSYVGEEGKREVQSFHVSTEEFFKFIKLEVHSHYGTEFFCPLSLFKIYGLSEFEVIEEAEDTDEVDEDQMLEEEDASKSEMGKEKQGFTIQAAIKSVVNDILEVIKRGSRSRNITNQPELNSITQGCMSLDSNFTIKKEFCSFADSLNYILACYYQEYLKLMENPFLSYMLQNNYFCQQLAKLICTSPSNNDSYVYDSVCNNSYVCVMLSPKHILAMCHMSNPSLLNDNMSCDQEEVTQPKNVSSAMEDEASDKETLPYVISPHSKEEKVLTAADSSTRSSNNDSVKSIAPDSQTPVSAAGNEEKVIHLPYVDPSVETLLENGKETSSQHTEKPLNNSTPSPSQKADKIEKVTDKKDKKADKDVTEKLKKGDDVASPSGTTHPPSATTQMPPSSSEGRVSSHSNKESVVVRLSNKIKVLEHNMSISSQYLEELSRRYKRQMEEMQRQFNSTSQTAYERDLYHQKRLESLEHHIEKLTDKITVLVEEKENLLMNVIEQHMILLFIEVCVMCLVFSLCLRRRKGELSRITYNVNANGVVSCGRESNAGSRQSESDQQGRETPSKSRRRSVDSIKVENEAKLRERRHSGQMPVSGSYKDLLLTEGTTKEKKKKKKNSSLERSLSNASIHDSKRSSSAPSKKERKLEKLRKSSAGVIFSGEKKGGHLSRITSPQKQELIEEIGYSDWQVVRRNKSKSKGETLVPCSDEQPFVLSSDLKRGKITIVEEPLCNVYQHQYYTEMLYDPDYNVYGKEYLGEEQYGVELDPIVQPEGEVYVPDFDCSGPVINDYYHSVNRSKLYSKNAKSDVLEASGMLSASESNAWEPNALNKSVMKPLQSPVSTTPSSAFKGKTRLRSDNWEWYSSQPSRLTQKAPSAEVISNSSSDSGSRSKGPKRDGVVEVEVVASSKQEKRRKKKNKASKLTNGESH